MARPQLAEFLDATKELAERRTDKAAVSVAQVEIGEPDRDAWLQFTVAAPPAVRNSPRTFQYSSVHLDAVSLEDAQR